MNVDKTIVLDTQFAHFTHRKHINAILDEGITPSEGNLGEGVYCVLAADKKSRKLLVDTLTEIHDCEKEDLVGFVFSYTGKCVMFDPTDSGFLDCMWYALPKKVEPKLLTHYIDVE